MATPKQHHVRFEAQKKISESVDVEFVKKDGTRVDFPAHQKVEKTVKVDFMARNKRK